MVKLYILLLVVCSLYLNGADPDNPDERKAVLEKWGEKQSNLSDLTENKQEGCLEEAIRGYIQLFGRPEDPLVLHTSVEQNKATQGRAALLKLALKSLKDGHQEATEIMHLAANLELALRECKKSSISDGLSPRTFLLWGKIREVRNQESCKEDIFFKLAKQKLKENPDVKQRGDQLVELARDALTANDDEMALILMRVKVAFDRDEHNLEMSDDLIDGLFKKATVHDQKVGDGFSPRTTELVKEITTSKKTKKALLEWLF